MYYYVPIFLLNLLSIIKKCVPNVYQND